MSYTHGFESELVYDDSPALKDRSLATGRLRSTLGRTTVTVDSIDLSRVLVLGTTGSGKTTVSRALASRLGVTHIELDAYRHGPNWTETPNDQFREALEAALDAIGDAGWVADGNYSMVRDVLWPNATAVVWLDFSFGLVFSRLVQRTVGRAVKRTELWNGNRENFWSHLFTTDSLFLWSVKTHWSRRKRLETIFSSGEYTHLTVLRFRKQSQLRRWFESSDWPGGIDPRCRVQQPRRVRTRRPSSCPESSAP